MITAIIGGATAGLSVIEFFLEIVVFFFVIKKFPVILDGLKTLVDFVATLLKIASIKAKRKLYEILKEKEPSDDRKEA